MNYKILVFVIVLFANNCAAQNTYLWKIIDKKDNTTSFLMGTRHTLTSEYIDAFPIIEETLGRANTVVFEANTLDTVRINRYFDSLPENGDLKKLLTPKQMQFLKDKTKNKYITKMTPSMAVGILMNTYNKDSIETAKPKSNNYSNIENYLFELAAKHNKQVIYLESPEKQIETLFQNKPNFLMRAYIKKALVSLIDDGLPEGSNKKKISSDEKKEQKYFSQENEYLLNRKCSGKYGQVVLKNRNENWLTKLPSILQNGNAFISVGTDHLRYQCGLIFKLRKLGYEVVPIDMRTGKELQ